VALNVLMYCIFYTLHVHTLAEVLNVMIKVIEVIGGKMLSLGQEHCYCHRRDAFLKLKGKTAHATITVFLTYLGSVVTACCLTVRNTGHPSMLCCSCSGDRKGVRSVKVLPQQFPKVYF